MNNKDLSYIEKYSFMLDLVLFPVSTHISLLFQKKTLGSGYLSHVGITFILFAFLVGAGYLQLISPKIGPYWMTIPLLSGFILFFLYSSSIKKMSTLNLVKTGNKHFRVILLLITFFLVLGILPELDLIEFKKMNELRSSTWYKDFTIWQDLFIIFAVTLFFLIAYMLKAGGNISINRLAILYSCFLLINLELILTVTVLYNWMSINNWGFGTILLCGLLSAYLSSDYLRADTVAEFIRTFFLKTCTKSFNILLLAFCFIGLPQKVASSFISNNFQEVRPNKWNQFDEYFIYTDQGRFQSGHKAADKIRSLITNYFLLPEKNTLERIFPIIEESPDLICTNGKDICSFMKMENFQKINPYNEEIPFFRPINPSWDVFLTALLKQGVLTNIDETIAGFKSNLPKSLKGNLPPISTPYESNYVALAAQMDVKFIEPSYENIKRLLTNHIIPVTKIYLTGKKYWGAILSLNETENMIYLRREINEDTQKSIQVHFDSKRESEYKKEIQSRQIIVLPLSYFKSVMVPNLEPLIVFISKDHNKHFSALFKESDLYDMDRVVKYSHRLQKQGKTIRKVEGSWNLAYARYLAGVAEIKSLMKTEKLELKILPDPDNFSIYFIWADRLKEIKKIIKKIGPLKEVHRLELAYKLVRSNKVLSDLNFFTNLALKPPIDNTFLDCTPANEIGKYLYLSGHYQEALPYLELANRRHAFSPGFDIWYHLVLIKLDKPLPEIVSNINSKRSLWLYYQTLSDLKKMNKESAFHRLKGAVEDDSHDIMANQLLNKYFGEPLDEKYFFTPLIGL